MKKGQVVKLYLDAIEGAVQGMLEEQYSNDRWLIKHNNTNVVRIVREGSFRKDGCGYLEV